MTCSNSIPAVLRQSKQAWSMVGARVVCSAGARAFGAGREGASAGRGGGNGGDAAVDALEACGGKASSAVIMKKARMRMCACGISLIHRALMSANCQRRSKKPSPYGLAPEAAAPTLGLDDGLALAIAAHVFRRSPISFSYR